MLSPGKKQHFEVRHAVQEFPGPGHAEADRFGEDDALVLAQLLHVQEATHVLPARPGLCIKMMCIKARVETGPKLYVSRYLGGHFFYGRMKTDHPAPYKNLFSYYRHAQ